MRNSEHHPRKLNIFAKGADSDTNPEIAFKKLSENKIITNFEAAKGIGQVVYKGVALGNNPEQIPDFNTIEIIEEELPDELFNISVKFEIGKSIISKDEGDKIIGSIKKLKGYPSIKWNIFGHTCDLGGDRINKPLSQKRAEALNKFVLEHGELTEGQINQVEGKSSYFPVFPNDTEEHRQINRRAEIFPVTKIIEREENKPFKKLVSKFDIDKENPDIIFINLFGITEENIGINLQNKEELARRTTILLDGENQIFVFEPAKSETIIKTDIVILLDVTKSMAREIKGVKNSLVNFIKYLNERNIDVKVGVVTFADKIIDFHPLTNDFSEKSSIMKYLKKLYPAYMGEGGKRYPEDGLSALLFAANKMDWREESNKTFILITDAKMHYKGDGSKEHNCPINWENFREKFKGLFSVHCICPEKPEGKENYLNPIEIANEFSGTINIITKKGIFDLSNLPLAHAIATPDRLVIAKSKNTGEHKIEIYIRAISGEIFHSESNYFTK